MNKQLLVLHLGSNLGNRFGYLQKAITALTANFDKALKQSEVYETKAWGVSEQPDFLNLALVFETELPPLEVLKAIKLLEKEIGRRKRSHWYEREIDIDIIFYGDDIIAEPDLEIPHKQMHLRRFVLQLLNEIIPDVIHPVFNKSVHQLFIECPDPLDVKPWKI